MVTVGGQETAFFLTRGEGLAKLLRLDRVFKLKVLPISLALPWGVNVGDMMGHIPLPAKITIQVLPPIDLRDEFGENPDTDEVYDAVIDRMQRTLTGLASSAACRWWADLMRVEEHIEIEAPPPRSGMSSSIHSSSGSSAMA